MLEPRYYVQSDFEKIIYDGVHYTIPEYILHKVMELENRMKQKVAAMAQIYEVRTHRGNRNGGKQRSFPPTQSATDEANKAWSRSEDPFSFVSKSSVDLSKRRESDAEGEPGEDKKPELNPQTKVKEIMIALNKISKTNYEVQLQEVRSCLQELVANMDMDFCSKVVRDIYAVCIRNMPMGDRVADLYATIVTEGGDISTLFQEILQEGIADYLASFGDIRYVDPEKDNDGFCEYTKKNTTRRCTTKFMLHMLNRGVIPLEIVTGWIDVWIGRMAEMLDNTVENRRNEFEEFTENLFLLLMDSSAEKGKANLTVTSLERLQAFSSMSVKERPNLTSRSKFKIQDLVKKIVS